MSPEDSAARPDREALLRALEGAGVLYIVIGGAALETHEQPHRTLDVDITPATEADNLARLAEALNALDCELITDVDDPASWVALPRGYFTASTLRRATVWNLHTAHGPLDVTFAPSGFPHGYRFSSMRRACVSGSSTASLTSDVSAYSTPVGSATLAALLLQRARAGVCHRSGRAADLAKHLAQVAARGHGTTLRDQSSNRGRQCIGARSISGHGATVARDGRHDQGSSAACGSQHCVDRRRLTPRPGSCAGRRSDSTRRVSRPAPEAAVEQVVEGLAVLASLAVRSDSV
jgi:hypothetical protein